MRHGFYHTDLDYVAAYLHYIILYVNKRKMFWGVCISMSQVCAMYICLVLNCFVFFGVYCANKH